MMSLAEKRAGNHITAQQSADDQDNAKGPQSKDDTDRPKSDHERLCGNPDSENTSAGEKGENGNLHSIAEGIALPTVQSPPSLAGRYAANVPICAAQPFERLQPKCAEDSAKASNAKCSRPSNQNHLGLNNKK